MVATAGAVVEALGDPGNAVEALTAAKSIGDALPFLAGIAGCVALAAVVIVRLKADRIEEARLDDHNRGLR